MPKFGRISIRSVTSLMMCFHLVGVLPDASANEPLRLSVAPSGISLQTVQREAPPAVREHIRRSADSVDAPLADETILYDGFEGTWPQVKAPVAPPLTS